MTNTSTFGLPNFLFGPNIAAPTTASIFTPGRDVIFGNTTASNSTAIGTNFNVSTQETSTFYEGFLKPIDLQTLSYFIRQGYSRELLFWLFTDSFELSSRGRKFGYRYSPPYDYGCSAIDPKHRCFIDWVHNAALTGLTVEEQTTQKSGSSGSKHGGADPAGAASAKPTTIVYARFCFNVILAYQAIATVTPDIVAAAKNDLDVSDAQLYNSKLTCGSKSWDPQTEAETPQPDILPLDFGNIKFTIVPRSAYGVFEFLGNIMKMEALSPQPYYPTPHNRPYAETSPPQLMTLRNEQLFSVVRTPGAGYCFVHSWFYDGEYCVPEDAATTKRIFGLLAQLIAIQTAATDLSITPVVRVIQ